MNYDLDEQMEPEQFTEEDDLTPSKDVYRKLREQRRAQKYYEAKNKKIAAKHKAVFHRIDNQNHYVCDNCGKTTKETEGSLMYSAKGEHFYCSDCLKELYPNYRPIKLSTTVSKTSFMSNNFESQYNKGFK